MTEGADEPRIGVVTEPFASRPLTDVMEWLLRAAPSVTDLEVGAGGYAPTTHCETPLLLRDASAREAWAAEIASRGLRVAALNVWGNPLHPDKSIARKHDADLRDAIRLAVLSAIGDRAGHCHGKDVQFARPNLDVNGLLDRRWPHDPQTLPWNFAVVGRGRDAAWWKAFVSALQGESRVHTIAIEHEDPLVAAEQGIPEAADVLSSAR